MCSVVTETLSVCLLLMQRHSPSFLAFFIDNSRRARDLYAGLDLKPPYVHVLTAQQYYNLDIVEHCFCEDVHRLLLCLSSICNGGCVGVVIIL